MERIWKHFQVYNHDLNLDEAGKQSFYPNQKYEYKVYQNFVLHYVSSGKGFLTIDGEKYQLSANQGFILRRGREVYYYASNQDPWSYYWIGLSGKHFADYLERSTIKNANVIDFIEDSELKSAIKDICDLALTNKKPRNGDLKIKQHIYRALHAICEEYPNELYNHSEPIQRQYAEIAYEYINSNFNKDITVSEVADYIGISRSYLYRLFNKRYNESPQNLLMSRRIDLARHLLVETSMTIGEISQMVGYEDQLLFSKNFKKKTEFNPTQYRKLNTFKK